MRAAITFALLLAALGGAAPARAGQPAGSTARRPPCASCIVVSVTPQQVSLLPARLNGLEILVRPEPGADLPALLGAIAARGGRPGLLVRDLSDLVPAATLVLDLRASTLPFEPLLFELRTRLTALRAAALAPLLIVLDPPSALREALQPYTTAGYWDLMLGEATRPAAAMAWLRAGALLDARGALAVTRAASPGRWLFEASLDGGVGVLALDELARAAAFLTADLVPVDEEIRMVCGDLPLPKQQIELYLNPASLDRIAIVEGCAQAAGVRFEPAAAVERVPLSSGQAIVRITGAGGDRFADQARVAAPRQLTVDEIVARHQAAAARQAGSLHSLISTGTLTVSFEAPGFPAPVTVSSVTTIYRNDGQTDLEQQDIRVNGIAFREGRVPRLPIIEPERVAAPPLAITLGDRYRYRLEGLDTVRGAPAYVIAFEPRSSRDALFRGRAWIAADDFGVTRIDAAQTGLRGAVVASEQRDDFVRIAGGGWVLERSEIRQLYQGAAYRTPIHRLMVLTAHDVNPADFAARRLAAYTSPHIILRDTRSGYRYLTGEARRVAAAAPAVAGAPPGGLPGVPAAPEPAGGAASRVRTVAFGVIVDPNITRPLPFAGLSYLDFDLFGTGAQLNAFFGGTFGQLAFSVPSIRGSRWQLAGQAFGIAASYNDRAFVGGREQYDRNVRQRPASAAVWLLRPITTRLALRAGYDLDYTRFGRSDATAADFRAPADQVAHGFRAALDGQRGGWAGTIWWSAVRRSGWRAWGRPGSVDYREGDRDFQRYGASVVRSVIFSPRLVARGEASIMAGHDLDRFSRYAFGTFDNRLRGYPSALIRYDRGTVFRTALAWSPARLLRLDGFADTAFVHDADFARGVSRFTGIGAAVEAPAPLGLLLAAEWGYGVQGVNASGRSGTHVVRVTGYKMF